MLPGSNKSLNGKLMAFSLTRPTDNSSVEFSGSMAKMQLVISHMYTYSLARYVYLVTYKTIPSRCLMCLA